MNTSSSYFLPYQKRWLEDKSPVKIWEKSRRIGATYVQAFEDVTDSLENDNYKVYFSSADITAAKEYIDYCSKWAKTYNAAAQLLGEVLLDEEKGVKALVVEFENGSKIHALSSNPSQFRSKGGKVVLDEFAFHKAAVELWRGAKPATTWGFPIRILSTHNGQSCLYYKFIEKILKGILKWSHHKTDIFLAVEEGLYDKIIKSSTTKEERDEWIENLKNDCADEETFWQEYGCMAVDEATAFLTYTLIDNCTQNEIATFLEYSQIARPEDIDEEDIIRALARTTNELYAGVDVARKKDLTIIWLLELINKIYFTKLIISMAKTHFRAQERALSVILKHPKLRRCCIDATGLGMMLAENMQTDFGKSKVEPVTFTPAVKEDLAFKILATMDDRNVIVPYHSLVRADLHSVKKIVTSANNIRFDVTKDETDGHADRFWALGLALHASSNAPGPLVNVITSRKRRECHALFEGY